MNDTGMIILAAGASSRMGTPKQLLLWQGKTLVAHVADEAVQATLFPVIVVTGAVAEQVSTALLDKNVFIIHNPDWQEGMASGIAVGISKLELLNEGVKACVIAIYDQPFVSVKLFQNLIYRKEETGKGIVACTYDNTIGTPVLFDKVYFNELRNLKGADGARLLIKKYSDEVATIPFSEGIVDIDTNNDYRSLLNHEAPLTY